MYITFKRTKNPKLKRTSTPKGPFGLVPTSLLVKGTPAPKQVENLAFYFHVLYSKSKVNGFDVLVELVEKVEGSFSSWAEENELSYTEMSVEAIDSAIFSDLQWRVSGNLAARQTKSREPYSELVTDNADRLKPARVKEVDLKTDQLIGDGFHFPKAVIDAPGAGYAAGDKFTVNGGTGSKAAGVITAVAADDGAVEDFAYVSSGSYTKFPSSATPATTSASGSGFKPRIEEDNGAIKSTNFSLSGKAQLTYIGMFTAKDMLEYPVLMNSSGDDDVLELRSPLAVQFFFAAGMGAIRHALDNGTKLKQQIKAAKTEAEVIAITDDR